MYRKSVVQWLGGIAMLFGLGLAMIVGTSCDQRAQSVMGPVVESSESGPIERPGAEPMNIGDRTAFGWTGPDWSGRVHWEARYALSKKADGTSNWPVGGGNFLGDWNYIFSDTYAKDKIDAEAVGVIGPVGYIATADGARHNCGGWCTYFVRTVLYRSSYWAGYKWNGKPCHLTMPNFPGSVYGWCNYGAKAMNKNFAAAKPGWVLSNPDVNKQHFAILDVWTGSGWWVIDSNWLGTYKDSNGVVHYSYYIGKHFMPLTKLQTENWWVWAPTLATTN